MTPDWVSATVYPANNTEITMEPLNPFPALAEIEHEQSHYEHYLAKLQAIQAKRLVEDRDDRDDMLFDPTADEATAHQGYQDFMERWEALNP